MKELREKNEELYSHLVEAEAFILGLQKRIEELTRSEQALRSELTQERQATQPVGKGVPPEETQKERAIYELQQELQKANLSIQTLTLSA